MREILFRGKRIDNGEWVEGLYTENCISYASGFAFIEDCFEKYEVKRDTVGQFTGLTDKNGKKIFEGDIVRIHRYNDISVIAFHHGCFGYCFTGYDEDGEYSVFNATFDNDDCSSHYRHDIVEVIGNIYDNSELLEVKR